MKVPCLLAPKFYYLIVTCVSQVINQRFFLIVGCFQRLNLQSLQL